MSLGNLGIQHVAIWVRDVRRAREFYGRVLALTEVPRPAHFEFKGAWFVAGSGQQIHLVGREDLPPRTREHFCLRVENLDAARAFLESQGVKINPDKDYRGARRFVIYDPDENYIEICQFSEPWPEEWPKGPLPEGMREPIE